MKVDNLKILEPNKLKYINPDVVIITSVFYEEIKKLLLKIKKEHNLSFKILYLDNFYLYYLTEN